MIQYIQHLCGHFNQHISPIHTNKQLLSNIGRSCNLIGFDHLNYSTKHQPTILPKEVYSSPSNVTHGYQHLKNITNLRSSSFVHSKRFSVLAHSPPLVASPFLICCDKVPFLTACERLGVLLNKPRNPPGG